MSRSVVSLLLEDIAVSPSPDTYLSYVAPRGGPVVEPSPRWVRAQIDDLIIADSRRALLVREPGKLPVYFFPEADVRRDLLAPSDEPRQSPTLGTARVFHAVAGQTQRPNAAWSYLDPPMEFAAVAGHIALVWESMDHWYEEAEEIVRHPRDPHKRIDAIPSSRHVRVLHGDRVLADSTRPTLLFETGHPVRYYLPEQDVRLDMLEVTATRSTCPYKGHASYWRLRGEAAERDIAWTYPDPIPECPKIKGLIAFFNERVNTIEVDGQAETRPSTSWS